MEHYSVILICEQSRILMLTYIPYDVQSTRLFHFIIVYSILATKLY